MLALRDAGAPPALDASFATAVILREHGVRDAEAIVRAIIALARSLGMTVTAEGVESERQMTFLSAEGCDFAQGYHLSVPLPQHEFAAMLRNNWQLRPAQAGRTGRPLLGGLSECGRGRERRITSQKKTGGSEESA